MTIADELPSMRAANLCEAFALTAERFGPEVALRTVNDPAEVQRLVPLGIDGLITDAVDRFSAGLPGLA